MAGPLAARRTPVDALLQKWRFNRVRGLIPAGSVLLDIGCGDGSFIRSVGGDIDYGIGLDRRLKVSFRRDNYLVKQFDLDCGIPLERGCVDVVTALAVVEHIGNFEYLLSEVHRVLRDGGKFIFTTPSPSAKPLLELLAFRLRLISGDDIADHKRYFSSEDLKQYLKPFRKVVRSTFQLGLNQLYTCEK